MLLKRLLRGVGISTLLLVLSLSAFAQKTITGKINDSKDGSALPGVSVTVKGTSTGTTTKTDGTFSLTVPENAKTLVISSVGYAPQEVSIGSQTSFDVLLVASTSNLNEVVVVGYGTARRKDLTGSYTSIAAKNFNTVPSATPDQLLQGKVAGLQIVVANGQPGAATIVKIRGNNSIRAGTNPLYVVDGVPLDGRSARPTFSGVSGLGNLPDANPLTYLNPADIESVAVLKDASASAIYGSRGANGVILITTKAGASGPLRVDVGAAVSTDALLKQPDVLSADEYRTTLPKYNAHSDSGASFKPFDKILQHKITQNYSLALSGGSENARYRASFLASSNPGIIRKSKLDKYIGNFNGTYRLLDRKLTIAFGVTAASTKEQIAPISNDPGSTGNLVSLAMQWNPTLLMKHSDGSYTVNRNGQVNPLALSDAYNDYASVVTLLAYITGSYKITPDLEYKLLYGANESIGERNMELQGWITGTGGNADGKGQATVGSSLLFSQTLSHTLNYTHQFSSLRVSALAGYEYGTTSYKTKSTYVYGFNYNLKSNNLVPVHYYDNMQDGARANLTTNSSNDPSAELQSYFARVQLNYKDRFNFSGSFRADGSSKFGSNNQYGYFPAVSAGWNIISESFMKNIRVFNNLALRVGWGETGNQSFPAGAAVDRYRYNSNGSLGVVNFANPDLKWETLESTNAGIDFAILNNKLTGSVDVFNKKTKDPLFPGTLAAPAPSGIIWENLAGDITNKGFEVALDWLILQKSNLTWRFGGNVTNVKNKFHYAPIGGSPLVLTGQLNGKGTSATWVQAIANDQPIDVFFLRQFHGFDKDGFAITDGAASYAGDPNPSWTVGLNSELDYKKWALIVNMHGAFNYVIYNNTLQSVTGLGFITNGSNISKQLLNTPENIANPVSASTRYMQKGDFMKLGNLTVRYNIGNVGKVLKNASAYVSGYNVFVLTNYKGFDPEVNVTKVDFFSTGIPSIGIDYVGYPSVRTFTVGINFSLY